MSNRLITWVQNLVTRKPQPPYVIVEPPTIPFHIKQFSKMFPIHIDADNKTIGEIKILQHVKDHGLYPGQLKLVTDKTNIVQEWWVYLGNEYFKLLYKR